MPYFKHLMDANRYGEREIEQTACLCRADGAVILDWSLLPLGIAAKFKVGDKSALTDEVRGFLESGEKGLRHASMAYAVNGIPGALGIVASEDGDCTLFTNFKAPPGVLRVVQ
jgi:hypothetical protein